MSDNTALWKEVEKTDPDAVKPITGKPYKGNSPKPHWLFYRATQVFGPCGIGWGVKILSERIEDGSAGDKVHIAHVLVWYEHGGKRGEVEHVGQTMFAGKRNDGKTYTDEDAPKKSVTDATVKALSMIGFAGDIFSGRWDDSKYVQEMREEFREAEREARAAVNPPPPVTAATLPGYIAEAERQIAAIDDRDALVAWWKSQGYAMEKVGIAEGDDAWSKLRDTWTRRGRAISVNKSIAHSREAA